MRSKTTLFTVALLACYQEPADRSSSNGSTTDGDDTTGGTGDTAGTGDTGGTGGTGDTTETTDTGGTDGDTADTGSSATGFECPEATGERPPALSEHFGVFDPVKERMVFFGGNPEFPVQCIGKNAYVGDTWAYWPTCNVWEKVAADGPSARGRAAAVYDEEHHAMVFFGGRFRAKGADSFSKYTLYDETWRLDLETDTWAQAATSGDGPSARILTSAAYDAQGGRMIVFGGSTADTGLDFFPQNDVYALDLNTDTWSQIPAGAGPKPREYHSAVYDPIAHAFVVHAGGDANAFLGPFFSDTWSLDLETNNWTQLEPGGGNAPDGRIWGRFVYASAKDRLLLFGGHDDGVLGNRNDLWMFDLRNGAWELQQLNDTFNSPALGQCDFPADFTTVALGTPERRSAHLLVYWEAENKVLIHGGKTDCGLIDDVWELDLDTWEWADHEPASIGESCLRYSDTCAGHCG